MSGALLTDLYELNMAASYLRRGMTAEATFSLFVRTLPPNRGFLVAAGAEDCLGWLEQFSFEPPDLDYLGSIGFDDRALDDFGALRFTGEVRGVPEGRLVLAGEPLLEVTAPIAEAQLVETYLLNQVSFQTMLATKAARCSLAAAGRIELVDFGFRRAHGIEAGVAAARLSAMTGFVATSNVEAARRFGLPLAGTMAHSYISAFPTEREAFLAFASDLPERTTFLVDTYDTVAGVGHAIEVIRQLGLQDRAGIRIDSGDLVELSRRGRRMLDDAGLPEVRIFVSGGLDEYDLAHLVAEGAPVDGAGVGTRMSVSADAPYLDTAYKLVSYAGRPVAKFSPDKATLPGRKQVFRGPAFADTITLHDEDGPPGTVPLLEPLMAEGRRLEPPQPLSSAQARFEGDMAGLPEPARDVEHPIPPVVRLSPRLRALTDRVRAAAGDGPRRRKSAHKPEGGADPAQ